MTAEENWEVVTHTTDDVPAVDQHHTRILATKLRKKWTFVDSLVVEWKRGPNWVPTEHALAMPEDRKAVTPEGGAQRIVSTAREYSENHQHRRRVRVNILGRSQSGDTTKSLFVHILDFTEIDEDGEADEPARSPKHEKAEQEVAVLEVMRRGMEDSFGHWKDAMSFVEKMADKVVELAETTAENQSGLLEAIRLDNQFKREEREATERARQDEAADRRTDAIFDKFLDVGGGVFEEWAKKKMGLNADVFEGTFSSRLAAILKEVPDEKMKLFSEVLGDDTARLIIDASKGVDDSAFRELMRQAASKMPARSSQRETFEKLAAAIGDPKLVIAMMKLLAEASGN